MEEAYKMLDKYGGVICECPNCDGTFGTDMGLGIYDDSTVTKQAQKRILEKAIERLEGKKRCSETPYGPGSCIACGEAGESDDCVNAVVNDCIKEMRSLMGEVDT